MKRFNIDDLFCAILEELFFIKELEIRNRLGKNKKFKQSLFWLNSKTVIYWISNLKNKIQIVLFLTLDHLYISMSRRSRLKNYLNLHHIRSNLFNFQDFFFNLVLSIDYWLITLFPCQCWNQEVIDRKDDFFLYPKFYQI